jgi:hypothetical protein
MGVNVEGREPAFGSTVVRRLFVRFLSVGLSRVTGVGRIAAGASGASTKELVEAVAVIAAELASRQAPESPVACMELAERLGAAIDLGEAALAGLVYRVDSCGEVRRWGFSSTSVWLQRTLGMRPGRADERTRLARQLPRLGETAKRLCSGTLSYGYASTICEAVCRLDDRDAGLGERILLGLADGGGSASQVCKAGEKISETIADRDDREKPPEDAKRGFKRSWLQRSRSLGGGCWVKGWLNAEHTAVLDELVDPLAKPAGAADDRDHPQRTADALFSLLTRGHEHATITVIIDLNTLDLDLNTPDHATPPAPGDESTPTPDGGSAPTPSGGCEPAPGAGSTPTLGGGSAPVPGGGGAAAPGGGGASARLLGGGRISPERARELALTAGVSALILGPGGRPLYLGRRSRFASPGQRQILLARYACCAVEGCEIPARLCELHHTGGGWKAGVPTNIDRLAPLCSFHNKWVEEHPRRVQETTDDDGRFVIRCLPPWDAHPDDRPPDPPKPPEQPEQPEQPEPPEPPGSREHSDGGTEDRYSPGDQDDGDARAQGP